jgi:hypothetical protein
MDFLKEKTDDDGDFQSTITNATSIRLCARSLTSRPANAFFTIPRYWDRLDSTRAPSAFPSIVIGPCCMVSANPHNGSGWELCCKFCAVRGARVSCDFECGVPDLLKFCIQGEMRMFSLSEKMGNFILNWKCPGVISRDAPTDKPVSSVYRGTIM